MVGVEDDAGVGVPAVGKECPSGGSRLQSRSRQGLHEVRSSSQNPSLGWGSGSSFSDALVSNALLALGRAHVHSLI